LKLWIIPRTRMLTRDFFKENRSFTSPRCPIPFNESLTCYLELNINMYLN
jgi:hypothetical protein